MEADGLLAILVVVALRRVADRPLVRLTPANQLLCLPFSRFCVRVAADLEQAKEAAEAEKKKAPAALEKLRHEKSATLLRSQQAPGFKWLQGTQRTVQEAPRGTNCLGSVDLPSASWAPLSTHPPSEEDGMHSQEGPACCHSSWSSEVRVPERSIFLP